MYTNLLFTDTKIPQVIKLKWSSQYNAPCHSLIPGSIIISQHNPQAFVPPWPASKNAIKLLWGDEIYVNHFTPHSKPGMHLERSSDTWETSTIPLLKRKWKRLFVNGCEYNSHISTATKFLNPCQHETNTPVCLGSWRKNDNSSLKEMSYMQRWSDCSRNFSDLGQPYSCDIPCPQAHAQGCWWVLSPTRKEPSYSDKRFRVSYILFIIIIEGRVSYILFIIIIGGILIIFIYITRLASNEIF